MHRGQLTTLYLRGMPADVVREAKAAAARRGSTLAALVADTLVRSLSGVQASSDPSSNDLTDSMKWYEENRDKLLGKLAGEYIAIADRTVIDHDRDHEALATRVFARLGPRSVFMPRVQATMTRARVRSPRRSRP